MSRGSGGVVSSGVVGSVFVASGVVGGKVSGVVEEKFLIQIFFAVL